MSVQLGTTFIETVVMCQALKCQLDNGMVREADVPSAEKLLDYFRSELWHAYPYHCEDHLDQNANNNEPYSITLLPEEVIAANVAAREAAEG